MTVCLICECCFCGIKLMRISKFGVMAEEWYVLVFGDSA